MESIGERLAILETKIKFLIYAVLGTSAIEIIPFVDAFSFILR